MTDTVNFPEVTQLAVPFFIATILAELGWIVKKAKAGAVKHATPPLP